VKVIGWGTVEEAVAELVAGAERYAAAEEKPRY
jgi:hypothetical protein